MPVRVFGKALEVRERERWAMCAVQCVMKGLHCIKPFLDAFNHYLWHDDSCIYRVEASKEHYHSTCIVMELEVTND